MKLKYFIIALPILAFLFSASPIVRIKESNAAAGDVQVRVTRQGDDAPLEGALVEIRCAGGDYFAFDGDLLTDSNGQVVGAPPAGANCDTDEETINARVSMIGYVTKNNEGGLSQVWSSTSNPNTISMTGIEFGLAVYAADQFGTAIDTLDLISYRGAPATLQDPVETNRFYWADTDPHDGEVIIEKDGFVSFLTTNSAATVIRTTQDEQVLITLGNSASCQDPIATAVSCKGLEYGYMFVAVQAEVGGANLSGVNLTLGGASCVENSESYYCPVSLFTITPHDSYIAVSSGYVTKTFAGGGFGFIPRSANADVQVNLAKIGGMQFAHKFIVVNELGNPLTLDSAVAGTNQRDCVISGTAAYCPLATNNDNFEWHGLAGEKDGYVTTAPEDVPFSGGRGNNADPQVVTTMTTTNGLKFSHKITGIKDELGNNVTPTSATAGANYVACVINSNTAYCPVLLADDSPGSGDYAQATISKDGYRSIETSLPTGRTANNEPQVVYALSIDFFNFAHRIFVNNELDQDITPDSVTAGSNDTVCTIDGFAAYCPIPIAEDNIASDGFVIAKDGYVTATADLLFDRTNEFDTTEDTQVYMDASNGLDFAVKTTVTKASDNSALSGATVSTGDLLAVGCTENGVTGIYYCAVPLAHTATEVDAVKSGFTANFGTFTDRTLSTDPQQTVLIALSVPVVSNGGGGGVIPQATCSSVTYGEWQNSCVNGIQYRNILISGSCSISAAQRLAAQRSCTNESILETPQDSSSASTLMEQVTALEKTLTATIDKVLTSFLLGRILLQVESHGESWYLNPIDSSRYFMGRPLDAFNLMRHFALGVNNADMQEFLVSTAPRRLSGRILMNVDDKGKAYYVNPLNLKLYYLGSPDNAFSIMKSLGLGITNIHLRQIKVGEL